jgi:hypothetical protein
MVRYFSRKKKRNLPFKMTATFRITAATAHAVVLLIGRTTARVLTTTAAAATTTTLFIVLLTWRT